jgi:hypothetical protein
MAALRGKSGWRNLLQDAQDFATTSTWGLLYLLHCNRFWLGKIVSKRLINGKFAGKHFGASKPAAFG